MNFIYLLTQIIIINSKPLVISLHIIVWVILRFKMLRIWCTTMNNTYYLISSHPVFYNQRPTVCDTTNTHKIPSIFYGTPFSYFVQCLCSCSRVMTYMALCRCFSSWRKGGYPQKLTTDARVLYISLLIIDVRCFHVVFVPFAILIAIIHKSNRHMEPINLHGC